MENIIGDLFCGVPTRTKMERPTFWSVMEDLHQMKKWAVFPPLYWRILLKQPVLSLVPICTFFFFFFFSVFCRINRFQETTGQEVKEDGISSWEVWFPQVRRCGGSSQEALSAHGDHHTLWIPSVQSIWESHSGEGQDSISFQHTPIRWTPARNWELAKNCVY